MLTHNSDSDSQKGWPTGPGVAHVWLVREAWPVLACVCILYLVFLSCIFVLLVLYFV